MGLQTVEAGPFRLEVNELLTLRVLLDKSIVEVYANDRQAVVRRIYPTYPASVGVKLFSEGGAMRVHRLTAWEMMPSNAY
jgi:beta-fructofuranosidase